MKRQAAFRKTSGLAAACALALLMAPAPMLARPGGALRQPPAPVAQEMTTVRDIALQAGGTLQGTVVDNSGMPQANYEVWIAFGGSGLTVKTRTDASGRFIATGIEPGMCSIDTPCGGGKFRLWEAKAAPRDAQTSVLLVVCAPPAG